MALNSNCIYFTQYVKEFQTRADQIGNLVIEMNEFFLLDFENSSFLKSYRKFPKDLKIVTNSQTYYVCGFVFYDLCKVLNLFDQDKQITLQIDDEESFSKIIDLINLQKVHLTKKDYPSLQQISKELQINTLNEFLETIDKEMSIDAIINPLSLIDLMLKQPQNFSISTRNNTYKCNKITATVSEIIMDLIQKEDSIDSYFYDFSDENDEFQIICDFLNFKPIQISPHNFDLLTKFATDFKFETMINILQKIRNINSHYDAVMNKYQDEIDELDELFEILTTKNESECIDFIVQSKWITNDQLQKEFLGSLLSLVYSSPKLITKMAKILSILFKKIQKEKNEFKNIDLKMLRKFLIKKISKIVSDSHTGPFIYELITLNFFNLQISDSICSNNSEDFDSKSSSDSEDSDLLLQCINDQYAALWLLPEIDSIVPNLNMFIEQIQNVPNNVRIIKNFMKPELMKDNWQLYKKIREMKQINNPIALSIATDDIDQFQKLIQTVAIDQDEQIKRRSVDRLIDQNQMNQECDLYTKVNNKIPPFEFDLYSGTSYADYAAFHGSVKCFKYLLLNGATISSFTFDAAVEGGNIELVHIIEQKLIETKDDSYYNGKSKPSGSYQIYLISDNNVFPRSYLSLVRWNGLMHAISNHNDGIFDWIFENKSIKQDELYNLLLIASLYNNVHVLSRILSSYLCFPSEISIISLIGSISKAESFGFSLFIRILIDFYGEENYKNLILNTRVSKLSICECDNVELFKILCVKQNDFSLFSSLCKSDSTNIFKYCFEKTDNIKLLEYFCLYSIKNRNEEIFNFLINQIKSSIPLNQQETLFTKLLINSVNNKNFSIIKSIVENTIKFSHAITDCLIITAKNGNEKIFNYLLQFHMKENDKKLRKELMKNFLDIIQSGNIKIIKSMIEFIDNEEYTKLIIFNALVDESNLLLNLFDSRTNSNCMKQNGILFNMKNVTEFLISYIDKVIPEFLLSTVIVGNIEATKEIVSRNSSYDFLNNVFCSCGNALIIACQYKRLEIVKFFLKSCQEIDPNVGCYFDKVNSTPLMISFSNRSVEIIEEIINFYKSREKDYSNSEPPPNSNHCIKEIQKSLSMINDYGISNINSDFVNLLSTLITIDGVNINEIYCSDFPFLYLIAKDHLIDLFNIALSLPNVNPNVFVFSSKETPLIKAISTKQNKVVLSLLSHDRIDINFESMKHITALSTAVKQSNIEIVKLLVQNKKLEINLNYINCLNDAILSGKDEYVNLLLSREDCNVNEIIPNSIEAFSKSITSINIFVKSMFLNFELNSSSILQTAVKKRSINFVKSIIDHPKFIADKSTITLALFESVKCKNMTIFELLKNKYLKLSNIDDDLLNLLDTNNNSLVVVASASDNIEFLESIENVNNNPSSFSLLNYQLAFIVAPSFQMMKLIIEKLPGVDLNLPMENGNNYMTSLIDFYYSESINFEIDRNYRSMSKHNENQYFREKIIIDKLKFIQKNSNLKLTTRDKKGFSFISKAASRIHCTNFLQLIMMIYQTFFVEKKSKSPAEFDDLIEEETKMNPLHFIAKNLPIIIHKIKYSGYAPSVKNINADKYDDDFNLFVNKFINGSDILVSLYTKYSDNLKQYKNVFKDHVNSVDFLKQTPIIKAVLNMNLSFAAFLLSDCSAKIENVDVFGKTVLDYLLMISDIFYNNKPLKCTHRIKDWRTEKNENNYELCNYIIKNLSELLSVFDCDFICMIIIKLSSYLVEQKQST